jgi:fumarate reductase subunit C
VVRAAFLLLHAVTFANLTPRAMVVRLRGRRVAVPDDPRRRLLGWLVVTAFLAWLVVS